MNQCVFLCYLVCVFIFSFFMPVQAHDSCSQRTIVVYKNTVFNQEAIKDVFSQDAILKQVSFDADIQLQREEFLYLLDMHTGEKIRADQLIRSIDFFIKKNKFSAIVLDVNFFSDGAVLHFSFSSHWTFRKVKIHGIFQGKNAFLQSYVMGRGDIFSHTKHNHSIRKMKELLEGEGYCDNQVSSRFEYDKKNKEVVVHISIKKSYRFLCGDIAVEMTGDDADQEYDELRTHIAHRLRNKLSSQKYKKESINNEAVALKAYLGRKGFLQTGLELQERKNKHTHTVDLLWKITVHHKRTFIFFGNNFFTNNELLEKVLTFGRSTWIMPATLLAEEVLHAYKNKGFWKARVVGQEEKERSFFVIEEGPRAVIAGVEIHGATFFEEKYLKRHYFHTILSHKYYDGDVYNNIITALRKMYMQAGFLSFSVTDHVFVPAGKENEYTLIVSLDEGVQSYIASVEIVDHPELRHQGPFATDFQKQKILFNAKIIDDQREWLLQYFQKMGYLYPKIKSSIVTNDHEIHISWSVDPGEKIYFGKTIIAGQSSFPFQLLQKLLGYREGEMWDQEKIKQTFKTLKDLDIFESINLVPDYADNTHNKSVMCKMYADDSYEIRARAGLELQHVRKYQTFNGLTYKIGGTGLVRNPCNVGDIMRLDLDFARSHREVVARYKRPLFLKVPLLSTLQAYSISYDQPGFVGSVNDIYTLVQNGFSYSFERKTSLCEVGFRVGVEGMMTKIKDPQLQKSLIKAIDFQPQLVDKMVPFFLMEPTIMFEFLDNALNPTSGFLTLCSLKSMVPCKKKYKNTLFVKLTFEQSFFVPLYTVVAAFRVRFGHIFYRKLSAIMPSERFYLGGSHSLRGYEMDLAPPLGVFVDEETHEHIVPRGGKSMLNINTELRFPIYKKFGGVIFQDFGILSGDTFDDFKPQNFLGSTGFGGRFYTPLGPLRFDIGWKWRKQIEAERSFAWFLSFGQAF